MKGTVSFDLNLKPLYLKSLANIILCFWYQIKIHKDILVIFWLKSFWF